MKKSIVLFPFLSIISSCTNYPANDNVNREFVPYPDKELQEEYEKHQKELKQETIDKSTQKAL